MASAVARTSVFVFTGAYTGFPPHARGRADGVTVFRMQPETGALTHVFTQPGVDNPTFLAVSANHRFLYAINAVSEVDGVPGGAVEALSIDQETGALTYLNRESTIGPGPAFVAVDRTGRFVLAANYHGGSIALFPVRDDGQLAPASDFIQHVGSSVTSVASGGAARAFGSILIQPNTSFWSPISVSIGSWFISWSARNASSF